MIDGDPGLGKSTMILDIAARVTNGSLMPDGSQSDLTEPAAVILLSAEDGLDDTIRPRLDAAGADSRLVTAIVGIADTYGERPDRLPTLDDIMEIESTVRFHGARLLIVDPFMAYMPGRADSSRDQDVRSVLARFAKLAEETGVAIVLIRHLNKSGQGSAIYRGGGSIGIIGAARSGLVVARDPDDETGMRRIVAVSKSNVAAPVPALAYSLVPNDNGAVQVQWKGATAHTADGLLAAPSSNEDRTATEDAMSWLREVLADGPMSAKDVLAAAKEAGITDKPLRMAASRLRLKRSRQGYGKGSRIDWDLPQDAGGDPLGEPVSSSIDALSRPIPAIDALPASEGNQGIYGDESTIPVGLPDMAAIALSDTANIAIDGDAVEF